MVRDWIWVNTASTKGMDMGEFRLEELMVRDRIWVNTASEVDGEGQDMGIPSGR